MAWTRIDGLFLKNAKIQRAGIYGMALYISGLIYCNNALTDGFIDESLVPGLCGDAFQTTSRKSAQKLVEIGLWKKVNGGYQVHDFLELNRSKQEIENLNETKRANGMKGGRPRKQNQDITEAKPNDNLNRLGVGYDTENLNDNLKKTPKDLKTLLPNHSCRNDLTTTTGVSAREKNNFQLYEEEIGILSPTVRDRLISAESDYSELWVSEAIREAVANNVRKWSYVEAVLKGWRSNGFRAKPPNGRRASGKTPVNHGLETIRAMAEADGETLDGVLGDLSRFGRYTPPDGQVIDVEAQNG